MAEWAVTRFYQFISFSYLRVWKGSWTYIPNNHCFWCPSDPSLVVYATGYMCQQESEERFTLLLLQSYNASRNFTSGQQYSCKQILSILTATVDEEGFLSSCGMCTN